VPDCPYEALEGLSSKELRESLHEEIKDHTVLKYEQLRGDQAKVDVRADGMLWDMYSACDFALNMYEPYNYTITTECDKYNREHLLPKSWWKYSKENEANDPMYTDLHHVVSTDGFANEKRSAWVYDEVKSVTWTNSLGSKLGTGKTWNETSFEPVDEYKGDIARVYFYMLTCYMDKDFTLGGKGYRYFTYNNGVCDFKSQALALMLKWHRQDPVSEKEVVRNAKVADLQGNVNPFVVEPNLVEYIWGTMKGKAYDCDAEVETPDPGTVDGAITCQEARELALALADNTQSVEDYVVVGYVSALDVDYSTQYGNQSFWVADELNGGQVFYAYRCYNESPVNLGDKVSLTGKLLNYYGTPEMKLGQTKILVPAPATAVEEVEVLDWRDADVEVYSVTGQKMSGMREELPQGVYVLRRGDRVSRVVVR
jgi:endonuclease I